MLRAKPLQLQQLHGESVHLKNHQHFNTAKLFFPRDFYFLWYSELQGSSYARSHEYFTNYD